MEPFVYSRLELDEIRLLELHLGRPSEELFCSLGTVEAHLSPTDTYITMSKGASTQYPTSHISSALAMA